MSAQTPYICQSPCGMAVATQFLSHQWVAVIPFLWHRAWKDLKLSWCGLGVTTASKGIPGYEQGCDIAWAWGINNVEGQWDWA